MIMKKKNILVGITVLLLLTISPLTLSVEENPDSQDEYQLYITIKHKEYKVIPEQEVEFFLYYKAILPKRIMARILTLGTTSSGREYQKKIKFMDGKIYDVSGIPGLEDYGSGPPKQITIDQIPTALNEKGKAPSKLSIHTGSLEGYNYKGKIRVDNDKSFKIELKKEVYRPTHKVTITVDNKNYEVFSGQVVKFRQEFKGRLLSQSTSHFIIRFTGNKIEKLRAKGTVQAWDERFDDVVIREYAKVEHLMAGLKRDSPDKILMEINDIKSSDELRRIDNDDSFKITLEELSSPLAPEIVLAQRDVETLFKAMQGRGTDENRILAVLSDKTKTQIENIKAQYRAYSGGIELEDALMIELGGNDLVKALRMIDFPASEEPMLLKYEKGKFVYNYEDPELNQQLSGLYNSREGHLVIFVVDEQLPEKKELDNLLDQINTQANKDRKDGKRVILVYTTTDGVLHPRSYKGLFVPNFITREFLKSVKEKAVAKIQERNAVARLDRIYVESFIEHLA